MLKNKHFQLSTLNSQIVRSNPELMAFYITTFEKTFGYKPDCVGCSFTSDFQKLKNRLQTQKTTEIMENTTKKQPTFILRQKKGEILTYRKDDYTFRCYDYNLTEEFVINFLTYGTEEELRERKKLFSKAPSVLIKKQPSENREEKEVKNTETIPKAEEKPTFLTKKHKK